MVQRISIMLNDEIYKKLRTIQAEQVKRSVKSVSFSSVINQQLHKALKM